MRVRVLVRRVTSVLVVSSVASVAVLTGSAAAQEVQADVAVEVSAPRNILPRGGGTTIHTVVRNIGTAPAENVSFTVTLPQHLEPGGIEWTGPGWSCEFPARGTMTCRHVGPMQPGKAATFLNSGVAGWLVPIGISVTATASVTTSSPEAVVDNNQAGASVRFVGTGTVRGRIWHDLNANGVREPNEPPVDSIGISFRAVDDDDSKGFGNNPGGEYWLELAAKRFRAEVGVDKRSWRFTTPNHGDDSTDSDIAPSSETFWYRYGSSEIFTVEAGAEHVVDVGVVAIRSWRDVFDREPLSWRVRTVMSGEVHQP